MPMKNRVYKWVLKMLKWNVDRKRFKMKKLMKKLLIQVSSDRVTMDRTVAGLSDWKLRYLIGSFWKNFQKA